MKADVNSGLHFCFVAKDRKAVDAFHAAALKAGGKDNGKPRHAGRLQPELLRRLCRGSRRLPRRGLLREVIQARLAGSTFGTILEVTT